MLPLEVFVQGILDVFHPNSAVGTLRPRIWSGTAWYMDSRSMIPDDTLLAYRMYGPTSTSRSRSCTWEYRRHKRLPIRRTVHGKKAYVSSRLNLVQGPRSKYKESSGRPLDELSILQPHLWTSTLTFI
jgi:hypothetical protein